MEQRQTNQPHMESSSETNHRLSMKPEFTTDVVTIGESMVLFQSLQEGPLSYAPLFTQSVAGAESNVGIGLTRLGLKVRWISRLGKDPFGDKIYATLSGAGLDLSHVIRDPDAPTAVFFKENKGYGDPNVYYYRSRSAASRLSPDDLRAEWFEGARHLHVTGITPALGPATADAVAAAMKTAKESGMTVSFDPNLRRKLWSEEEARAVLLSLIPLCDCFMPGIEEAEFLIGPQPSAEHYGERFLAMGPAVVALKLGEEGSIGFTRKTTVKAAPNRVAKIVDTVGAGDAFAAGFLSVMLDKTDWNDETLCAYLQTALVRANLLGALATQYRGDWEGLPNLEEVERYQSGKATITR